MKPGGGRAKGARGELEVVAICKAAGYEAAHRTAPMQAGHAAAGYQDVGGVPGLAMEVKCYRRTPVGRFAKALFDQEPRAELGMPTLVWRDNGTGWRATVRLEDLLALLRASEVPRGTSVK